MTSNLPQMASNGFVCIIHQYVHVQDPLLKPANPASHVSFSLARIQLNNFNRLYILSQLFLPSTGGEMIISGTQARPYKTGKDMNLKFRKNVRSVEKMEQEKG